MSLSHLIWKEGIHHCIRGTRRRHYSDYIASTVRTYKTIILPVVLYGCETWSPTLREKHVSEEGVEEDIWTKEG
jgi:hypothetical protein